MARRKTKTLESLDYHEGLSLNQVKIVLRELDFNFDEFAEWMYGQTCPTVPRYDRKGGLTKDMGIFEYDLFRWIESKKTGVAPVFD